MTPSLKEKRRFIIALFISFTWSIIAATFNIDRIIFYPSLAVLVISYIIIDQIKLKRERDATTKNTQPEQNQQLP